jgi:hypothetical protein
MPPGGPLLARQRRMSTPLPLRRALAESSRHRIERYVPEHLKQVAILLDEARAVATREQGPDPLMPSVVSLGVAAPQPRHAPREGGPRRLHQQVEVVRHQAVRQTAPVEALDRPPQNVQEGASVAIVCIDRTSCDSTRRYVIDAVSDYQPKWTGHASAKSLGA